MHPLAEIHSKLAIDAKDSAAALAARAREKHLTYGAFASAFGAQIVGFVVDVYGRLGEELGLVKTLAALAAARGYAKSSGAYAARALQRISVALQNGAAEAAQRAIAELRHRAAAAGSAPRLARSASASAAAAPVPVRACGCGCGCCLCCYRCCRCCCAHIYIGRAGRRCSAGARSR